MSQQDCSITTVQPPPRPSQRQRFVPGHKDTDMNHKEQTTTTTTTTTTTCRSSPVNKGWMGMIVWLSIVVVVVVCRVAALTLYHYKDHDRNYAGLLFYTSSSSSSSVMFLLLGWVLLVVLLLQLGVLWVWHGWGLHVVGVAMLRSSFIQGPWKNRTTTTTSTRHTVMVVQDDNSTKNNHKIPCHPRRQQRQGRSSKNRIDSHPCLLSHHHLHCWVGMRVVDKHDKQLFNGTHLFLVHVVRLAMSGD